MITIYIYKIGYVDSVMYIQVNKVFLRMLSISD